MRHRIILALGALAIAIGISACGGDSSPAAKPAYPAGDAAKGELVFNRGCNACHHITTEKLIGPGMAGLFGPGGPTLPDGVDYGGNLGNGKPITEENVAAWIKAGGQGKLGLMPAKGNIQDLTDPDVINLIAYLKTLKK